MSDITSALKLIDLSVKEFEFKRNYEFSIETEIELQFNFFAEIDISEEQARLQLSCTIFDEDFNKNKQPFYLRISMYGFFESREIGIEDFQLNSMAILLPYLRAIVISFTAQTGLPPVIIPPINVYNLKKQVQKK